MGALLTQHSADDKKLHTCAFFSQQLCSAERNYYLGNHELLAVVLALQDWRNWLEDSEQSFVVWNDHKNISCLQSAKRLNSHQARWSLFLSRFNFTLTYRPGSRNIKSNALSHQSTPEMATQEPENILLSSCVVLQRGMWRWRLLTGDSWCPAYSTQSR